jgi:sugar-phosphatase
VKPVLLCDLDGVLVSSSEAIARVYRAWALSHDLDPQLVVATAQGRPAREVVALCAPELDAGAESARLDALHAAEEDGVVAIAGAAELLAGTPPERLAVVTSCTAALARARFATTGLPQPRVCITADLLTRGKPDPEGYERAAAALHAPAKACVVLEDAPAGIAAGLAAGMHVIAVLTSHERAELAGAHAFVADLHGVAAIAARLVG